MLSQLNKVLLNAASATGNLTSVGFLLEHSLGYAIQVVATGAPVGSLKLQVSCDTGTSGLTGNSSGSGVTNWTDLAGSTQAVSAAGSFLFVSTADVYYNWIRLVYTFTSGTGTITATFNSKVY